MIGGIFERADLRWRHEGQLFAVALPLAVLATGFAALLIMSLIRSEGRDFGATLDFVSFWSAGKLALAGDPAAAYDWETQKSVQAEALGHDLSGWMPFSYPPTFLALIAGFSRFPLGIALAGWASVTLVFYLAICWTIVPRASTLLVALAAGPVWAVCAIGQTGHLTAALLGMALVAERHSHETAALSWALLTVKPHLGFLAPLWLLCRRRFDLIAKASLFSGLFLLLSFLLFGTSVWTAFMSTISTSIDVAATSDKRAYSLFASIYGFARWAGLESGLALALHFIVAAPVLILLVRGFGRGDVSDDLAKALFLMATAILQPRLLYYDLAFLTIAGLFLFRHARRSGWLAGDHVLLTLAALLPNIVIATGLPLHALTPWLMAIVLLRHLLRVSRHSDAGAPGDRKTVPIG
ncbi:MAG: glycosyltransferase family 87 protein [Geminicoccaceae bacterium]